jgi:Polysaccharide lyase
MRPGAAVDTRPFGRAGLHTTGVGDDDSLAMNFLPNLRDLRPALAFLLAMTVVLLLGTPAADAHSRRPVGGAGAHGKQRHAPAAKGKAHGRHAVAPVKKPGRGGKRSSSTDEVPSGAHGVSSHGDSGATGTSTPSPVGARPTPRPTPPTVPTTPVTPIEVPEETTPPPVSQPEAPSPGGTGPLLFDGSFSAGLSAWYLQAIAARVSTVAGDGGGQAARFEVRDGDIEPQTGSQRAELVAPMFFDEGQDLYIHDEIRVPSGNTFDAPWQIIQQLHEDSSENSPGVAVFLENDHSLRISSGDGSVAYWSGPVLQPGSWYDLTYRVLLSQNPGVGTVEVWLDGVPQKMVNGSPTIHGPTATASRTFFKAGIYRSKSSTGTSIVEHDDLQIGSSRAAVES